jgi:hypothetical protein
MDILGERDVDRNALTGPLRLMNAKLRFERTAYPCGFRFRQGRRVSQRESDLLLPSSRRDFARQVPRREIQILRRCQRRQEKKYCQEHVFSVRPFDF